MVPPRKNNVRAETYISGYIIRPDSVNKNITVLELVTQVDVKVRSVFDQDDLNIKKGLDSKGYSKLYSFEGAD